MPRNDPGIPVPQQEGDPLHELSLSALVSRLEILAGGGRVSMRAIVEVAGQAALLPALTLLALMIVSPISGVPFFSSISGLVIVLISVQLLMNKRELWLPDFLMRREIPGKRLATALRWMRRAADYLERFTRTGRLSFLVSSATLKPRLVICLIAGLSMPVFEIVPFSSTFLAAIVLMFALSIMTNDGIFVLLGSVILALVVFLSLTFGITVAEALD
jgi:hypothetical protein